MSMTLFQRKRDLCQDVPDKVFLDKSPFLLAPPYDSAEISAWAVLHNDVDLRIGLVDDPIVVPAYEKQQRAD
jgi:hypothetical protein